MSGNISFNNPAKINDSPLSFSGSVDFTSGLPDFSGETDSYLHTDGSSVEWLDISDLITAIASSIGTSINHGVLLGLSNDDHPQYHNNTRGDIRYYTKAQSNSNFVPYTGATSNVNIGANDFVSTGRLDIGSGGDFANYRNARLHSGTTMSGIRITNATTGVGFNKGIELSLQGTHGIIDLYENDDLDVYTNNVRRATFNSTGLQVAGNVTGSNLNISNWDTAFGWGDHSGLYDTTGTALGLMNTHTSTYNHANYNTAYSHSQITTGNPHNIAWSDLISPPTLITDHGALTGLGDDDHTQYHTNTRGDARYYTQTQLSTSGSSNVHWENITNTPTTLAHYHITDAQPLDADLTALGALGSTGLAARTASNTWAQRTITATTPIVISNGNGVSGNPSITHANSLVTPGTYKSVTVDTRGHITNGSNPTTLLGYGIVDALPIDTIFDFSDLGVTPTTLSGYGITDAAPLNAGIEGAINTITVSSAHNGDILQCNGTFTVTLPNSLPTGFQTTIVNIGTGTITLSATTTLRSRDSKKKLTHQYGAVSVYHSGSNIWYAFGDLST